MEMSDTKILLPIYHSSSTNAMKIPTKETIFYSLDVRLFKIGWLSVIFSFVSFFFCVTWSILYNFEEANATHCSVENFLPSISAAIGHFYPQIYVWNISILLQMIPRLKISSIYFYYFKHIIYEKYSRLCYLAWMFQVCELWALLGLSLITSTSNYKFHAFCFVTFLFSSMAYMILSCYLLKFRRKIPPGNLESKTLKWKFKCCLINVLCFVIAGYFFRRHNLYCEPRVYSIFALFEYGVVISNILFHLPAVWDFYDRTLTVALTSRGIKINYSPPFKSTLFDFK